MIHTAIQQRPRAYGHRKVWREGEESGCQWCCGSQGKKRVEWIKPEHPYTAISPKALGSCQS